MSPEGNLNKAPSGQRWGAGLLFVCLHSRSAPFFNISLKVWQTKPQPPIQSCMMWAGEKGKRIWIRGKNSPNMPMSELKLVRLSLRLSRSERGVSHLSSRARTMDHINWGKGKVQDLIHFNLFGTCMREYLKRKCPGASACEGSMRRVHSHGHTVVKQSLTTL